MCCGAKSISDGFIHIFYFASGKGFYISVIMSLVYFDNLAIAKKLSHLQTTPTHYLTIFSSEGDKQNLFWFSRRRKSRVIADISSCALYQMGKMQLSQISAIPQLTL